MEVDVAIIGGGTAGLAAYRAAVAKGGRAVLIEGGPVGTTCARVGCMPSKLLIAAADAAHGAENGEGFGIMAEVAVDGRKVMDRLRRERDRFVGFVVDSYESIPDRDRIVCYAKFTAPGVLAVSGAGDSLEIRAKSVVIATGSAPWIPPMFDAVQDRVVLNDHVFDWDELPKSVAVFGAGVIGLELGQALHRLGVRVRVFGHQGRVGPLTDPKVTAAAAKIFGHEIDFAPEGKVKEVVPDEKGIRVRWEGGEETYEWALVAAGRRPNLSKLGLENAGVELDASGVPKFDRCTMQVGNTSVFIAGDANQDVPLLHEASDEGKIAGANAASFPKVSSGLRRSALGIVFTDPNIAMVGSTWAQVASTNPVVGEVDFADQGRSRVMLQNRGLLRLYADREGRFLGAEMVGPRMEHIAHLLAWAHQAKLTIQDMLDMPFYHPVVEEGLRTALRDVDSKLRTGEKK